MNENPRQFDPAELKYFEENPSKITNYLFLGSYSCIKGTKNKHFLKELGITHIVNCTEEEKEHPEHFIYFEKELPRDVKRFEDLYKELITETFPQFFDFIRNNAKQKARILVSTISGLGACLVIGFLMENRRIPFFEAFQFVQQKRYIIHVEKRYIKVLISWEKSQQKIGYKESFRCFCGINYWSLLTPLEKTEHQNPRACNCQLGDYSDCPNHDCGGFCERFAASTTKWRGTSILWGYTVKDNIQSEFSMCEEYTPLSELKAEQRAQIEDKPWTVYRCRKCGFICYAKNSNEIALVTNFEREKESYTSPNNT